jgi:methyl-accepting chemotaxis protein
MSLSVKARLISVLAGLSLAVMVIAAFGYAELSYSNKNIADIHDDGVVPIENLKVIADMYAVNIVDTAHKVRNGGMDWDEGISSLDKASATIKDRWATYLPSTILLMNV